MYWTDVVDLEGKLRIKPGQRFAVVNGPPEYHSIIPMADAGDPYSAPGVIGFVTHRADLNLLGAVYAAARSARVALVSYPKPGRTVSDLHRDWLTGAVRQYGVETVTHVYIDDDWSALLLRAAPEDISAPDMDDAWPGSSSTG